MNARLVVFDVAGTTVLDDDIVIEAMADAMAADGLRVNEARIRSKMGLPKPVAVRELVVDQVRGEEQYVAARAARIHRAFMDLARARYRNHPSLRGAPGTPALFSALHDRDVCVALDTGFNREILNVVLARLGWTGNGLIDVSVASDEVQNGRPASDLIRRAMQLTEISDPAEVVKVGDTPVDIQSGRAAGCGLVVAVSYGTHSRKELERCAPDLIVDRLTDLLDIVCT